MNPLQIIQMLVGNNPNINNNPLMKNAFGMMRNNDVNGLKQMAENLCREKNISLTDIQNQIKQRFGMK